MSVNRSFIFSRSPYLPVKVFIKVTKSLVMNLEEDEIFMCLAALLCDQFSQRLASH